MDNNMVPTHTGQSGETQSSQEALVIPEHPRELAEFLRVVIVPKFRTYGARCILLPDGRVNPKKLPLTATETDDIVMVCGALMNATGLNSKLIREANIKNTLLAILNRGMRKTSYPPHAVEAAQAAFNRFEADRWGAANEDVLSETEASAGESARRGGFRNTTTPPPQDLGQYRFPPENHPIYGRDGIMKGTIVNRGGRSISTKLSPKYLTRNTKVFGHNGLEVGTWWPRQICALRDGAHGSMNGGIHASKTQGAFSVVIAGAYEDVDQDLGDIIYYSGPNSATNEDPEIVPSQGAVHALELSFRDNRDIRVLRKDEAGWNGRPAMGLRYDGLYRVTNMTLKYNKKGGRYASFRMERRRGQAPLESVRSRPTARERADFDEVKNYY